MALTLAITSLCNAQMHEDRRAVKDSPVATYGVERKTARDFPGMRHSRRLAVMIYGVVLVMSRREEQRIREYYKNKLCKSLRECGLEPIDYSPGGACCDGDSSTPRDASPRVCLMTLNMCSVVCSFLVIATKKIGSLYCDRAK